jgi:hypothetical protein
MHNPVEHFITKIVLVTLYVIHYSWYRKFFVQKLQTELGHHGACFFFSSLKFTKFEHKHFKKLRKEYMA